MNPRLQVLICTTAKSIPQIDSDGLPAVDGVEYLICCQNPDGLPVRKPGGDRTDIALRQFANRGLSNNRNNSLGAASAPYLLIADDDLSFRPEGLRGIIRRFDSDPALGILTVRSDNPDSSVYPPDGHDLAVPFRHYEPISFEIALRRDSVEAAGLRFSPLAGIGAPVLVSGEENLFVHHCLRAGLKGRFADITAAVHPGSTTGFRTAGSHELLRTKGAVVWIIRGPIGALLRMPVMCLREPAPFFSVARWLTEGYIYAIKHRKEL